MLLISVILFLILFFYCDSKLTGQGLGSAANSTRLPHVQQVAKLNKNNYISTQNECIQKPETKTSSECCGEKMSYSFTVRTNNNLTENIISGRRFDCKLLSILHKYKLSDNYKINQKIEVKKPGNEEFIIVTAADIKYFPTLRKLLYGLKEKFGCCQTIIVYDLGGISEDKSKMEELDAVCGLEWRKFDWSIMSEDVRSLNVYAWKIYIIAETYTKYDTFIWMDTSIVINDANSLNPIFEAMEKKTIFEAAFIGAAGHSIQFATNLSE
uniref:Nucleotide-diphospho-sugar transferase domain-containing protein n=1 Tax=Meloidogyne hapla TaxID=6305 RepID=A0A1I8BAI2_MELHA